MPEHTGAEVRLFLLVMSVALAAGLLADRLLLGLLLGLLGYLGWHLHHLVRLPGQLAGRLPATGLRPVGLWKEIAREIATLQARSRPPGPVESPPDDRFREAVTALPEAVVILKPAGQIDWMNPAAEQLLGIDFRASAGRRFLELVRDPVVNEYLDRGEYEQPLVFSPPANRSIIASMRVTGLDRDGQQMIVARDITRQYHLDTAQRDFVANISHELRTPLTVISGLLEQLQAGSGDQTAGRRPVEIMRKQAARMSEQISDLLTLSRLELNPQPPAAQEVALDALLEEIAEEARTLGKPTAHTVELDIRSAASLRGERKELRAAISNLVINAVQHTPIRTAIRIRWEVDTGGGHLGVSDNGAGIAARHLPRLTERLYRVDASRSRDTGGTGLGLAIVRHVLERHGAELEISSTVGRGSTFSCHFPPERLIMPAAAPETGASE